MTEHVPTRAPALAVRLALTAFAALAAVLLITAPSQAASGGIGVGSGGSKEGGRYKEARLVHGKAIAPSTAPKRVKRAIKAANRIRNTKYVWGGGHGSFESRGYDCSGAVSYMLHGGGMLRAPMASGPLASSWGKRGKGKWITVYANGGHAYAEVAGLRWDTSGGPGPRWHRTGRSNAGFTKRHYKGL
jgi:hypothetical protein